MRYLAVIAFVSLLVGCGTAQVPFRLDDSSGIPRGVLLRISPDSVYSLSPLIDNQTGQRLVVTAIHVVGPSDTVVHQVYARFHRWNPRACGTGGLGCPLYIVPRSSYTAAPFTVGPRQKMSVELKLRFGSCSELASGSAAPISGMRITYRKPDGTTETRILSLGAGEIHLHVPTRANCFEPHSSISVNGPSGYQSSNKRALPSAGDVCWVANSQLKFRSRKFRIDRPSRWERVTVRIDHFKGAPGTYAKGTIAVVAAGKKLFRWHPVTVSVTTANRREVIAGFHAGQRPATTIDGTMRCRVR